MVWGTRDETDGGNLQFDETAGSKMRLMGGGFSRVGACGEGDEVLELVGGLACGERKITFPR